MSWESMKLGKPILHADRVKKLMVIKHAQLLALPNCRNIPTG